MLSFIQRKAAGHFHKATYATGTTSPKLIKWFGTDYNNHIDMLALDPGITAFACLSDGYLTVVKGVTILQDSLESRHKVISGCVGKT